MTGLLFAFVGRVSTEDNQEPEASRARQIAKARAILPPGAEIVAEYFDVGDSRSLPWARRPETSRLLAELQAGTNRWGAIVIGEFTRAFGAPIQYSTIYPLPQHFRVELWIPEIGGRVDYGSATTEILLGMLGGTSKRERDLIRIRVRDGIGILAKEGQRHLGGRPPNGYQLADGGEHPNPKKRALGPRLHRLEPDPVTGPVVRRIFEMFAGGQGLSCSTSTSPPAASPANGGPPKIAAVRGPDDAHPPLIDQELWDRSRPASPCGANSARRSPRSSQATTTPYQLRGLIFCGLCERRCREAESEAFSDTTA